MQNGPTRSGQYFNPMAELKWSPSEKAIARRAYQAALQKELQQIVDDAQKRMARIRTPSELWDLENWLGKCRRQIDDKYDYGYSVLPMVLAGLVYEGWLPESDLSGLRPDKMDMIRSYLDIAKSIR